MVDIVKDSVHVDWSKNRVQFQVIANDGDYITFPVVFKNDYVNVLTTNYYDGSAFNVCCVDETKVTDRNGFTIRKVTLPAGAASASTQYPVSVVVFGDLGAVDSQENFSNNTSQSKTQ